jgi:hypothetical protein
LWDEAWPSQKITQFENSLSGLESVLERVAKGSDDDTTAALARFFVVRACGFLEQVTEECCRSYLRSKSDPRASAFGGSWLGQGRGAHPDNLVALVSKFDSEWAAEFNELLDQNDQELRREISLLVNRRNKIAHGLSEGIGVRKALELAHYARLAADWFVLRLDPR